MQNCGLNFTSILFKIPKIFRLIFVWSAKENPCSKWSVVNPWFKEVFACVHFFSNWNSGGWSPIGSTRHCGHQQAYCASRRWIWWWRNWWNDDWQGKPKYLEKTCHSAALSTTNPTCSVRTRTRAAAVGSQQLTAWAMARPGVHFNHLNQPLSG
jgi:hypothetical protein